LNSKIKVKYDEHTTECIYPISAVCILITLFIGLTWSDLCKIKHCLLFGDSVDVYACCHNYVGILRWHS